MKAYLKTDKLKDVSCRGQKALVVSALTGFSTPKTTSEVVEKVDKGKAYTKLMSEGAIKHGGVRASVLYHLRALESVRAVSSTEVEGEEPKTKMRRQPADVVTMAATA